MKAFLMDLTSLGETNDELFEKDNPAISDHMQRNLINRNYFWYVYRSFRGRK